MTAKFRDKFALSYRCASSILKVSVYVSTLALPIGGCLGREIRICPGLGALSSCLYYSSRHGNYSPVMAAATVSAPLGRARGHVSAAVLRAITRLSRH